MIPTDHQLTAATTEAARHYYSRVTRDPVERFDDLDPGHRRAFLEAVLPIVHDALRGLPDPTDPVRVELDVARQATAAAVGERDRADARVDELEAARARLLDRLDDDGAATIRVSDVAAALAL